VIRLLIAAAVLVAVTTGSCANGATEPEPPQDPAIIRAPAIIAFTGVTVIPMTTETRLRNHTVVMRDGRIESLEPTGQRPLPDGAQIIDGRGRFLMPALIDMHVHLRRADLPAYLHSGIATVRNMWGHTAIVTMKRDIETGVIDGPSIHSLSNGLDAAPPQWPFTRLVENGADAVRAVDEVVAAGWKIIKVYERLSREMYDSVVAAATRRGVKFAGHVPMHVPVTRALQAGQLSIEHLGGYDRAVSRRGGGGTFGWVDVDEARFADLVRQTVQAGTWNCPTLAIIAQLAEQHPPGERTTIIRNRRAFVAELARQGARLLAGSDAGIDVVSPGTSLHDELREFVASGLTPFHALRAATSAAGEFLGVPGLGTVTVGAPAELLLVEADPLTDVGNARRMSGLVVRGTWHSVAALRP
jgi:imidazolonepropionase-like amidohydrolase